MPRLQTAVVRAARHYEGIVRALNSSYREGGAASGLAVLAFRDQLLSITHVRKQVELLTSDQDAAKTCVGLARNGAALINLCLHPRERIRWIEAAIRAVSQFEDSLLEARLHNDLGLCFSALGEFQSAEECFRKALKLSRSKTDPGSEGAALGNLGNLYIRTQKPREAIELLERVLEVARGLENRRWEADALNSLGAAFKDCGDFVRAIELHQQALALNREIEDSRGEGVSLINLGVAQRKSGNNAEALDCYQRALPLLRATGDERAEADVLWNMSLVLKETGDVLSAMDCAQAALAIRERLEDPRTAKVKRRLADWQASLDRGQATTPQA